MNAVVLYVVLLKATLASFAGLASLPVVRDELVVRHHVLTDEQLNEAVVITRSTPGPVGLYVVSVGYFAGGIPGAVAGWLAMITPALLILPLLRFAASKADHPRLRSALQAVVVASAGLLLAAAVPLGLSALTGPVTVLIAVLTAVLMLTTKIDTLWLILGAALATFTASSLVPLLAL
jgi:chromate transporter